MIKTQILKALRRISSEDETRIVICGIYVEPKEKILVSTDGRRLVVFEQGDIDSDRAFVMSNSLIDSLPDHSVVGISLKDEIISVTLPGNINYSTPIIPHEFPKWREVLPIPWPEKFDLRNLSANIRYLNEICEIAGQLGEGPGFVVTSHGKVDSVICVRSKKFTGLLMPIRADETGYSKPFWFSSE